MDSVVERATSAAVTGADGNENGVCHPWEWFCSQGKWNGSLASPAGGEVELVQPVDLSGPSRTQITILHQQNKGNA